MCLEGCDLLGGVVVVDTKLEVIGAADNPVLPRNKSTGTNGDIGEFEGFDDRLIESRVSKSASQTQREQLPGHT